MAQSQLNLYNMALAACGADYSLSATNESSIPASVCNLWYENVRQVVLRAAHWKSAKRYSRLTEETERDQSADWVSTDPEPGYAFSYALPSGLLAARYITDFAQFDIGYDNDKKILSCNIGGSAATDAPILCYTVDVTDVTLFEPDLYQAIIYGLAAHISMPLTGKVQRARGVIELGNNILLEARAATANEMYVLYKQYTERLQARGFAHSIPSPYIYPYGSMLAAPGAPLV